MREELTKDELLEIYTSVKNKESPLSQKIKRMILADKEQSNKIANKIAILSELNKKYNPFNKR